MKQIIKILEDNCDFNDINPFNYEFKIISKIKSKLEIEWYHAGGQKVAIKFKNNNYIIKIPYSNIIIIKEQAIYNLSNQLFDKHFYLKSYQGSQKFPIFYQEEVQTLSNPNALKKYNYKYTEEAKQKVKAILTKIHNLKLFNNNNHPNIPNTIGLWIYLSIKYYGEQEFIKLFNFYNLPFFFQDFKISNLGITKYGKPVIIDYN